MKNRIDAALHAAETSQEHIVAIMQNISRDDPRFELIDDAEMGIKWLLGRLKGLADSTPQSSDGVNMTCGDLDGDAEGDLSMTASSRSVGMATGGTLRFRTTPSVY